ncbi:hypothetical protein Tco_0717067 [Tanacetum coccineum]
MDPNLSVGKTCLGENVIEISSDKAERHGDWNSPEYQDTTNSGGKKETKAMFFHKMDTEEVSDRYVAPCFVNGLEAYDGEINLGVEENMISNEFAAKLCLEHEVKRGHKVVKKELIIALRGEIYFIKFIINPKEDDVELGVVLRRSFMRLTKGITDFENGTITIYPELDPFLFVCKRKQLENYKLTYSDMGPSMSTRIPFTREEAEREALAISICERYSLLEEERPVIKTIAYSDKYKKILDGICKINLNALANTGLDINVMPYHVYKELGREEVQNVKKEITMLNHSKAEPMGLLRDVLCQAELQKSAQVGVTTIIAKFLILDMPIDRDTPILVGRGFLHTCSSILNMIDRITSTFDGIYHQTFRAAKTSLDTTESDSDDDDEYAIQRNKFGASIYGPKPAKYLNYHDPLDRSIALPEVLNPFRKICVWKKVVSFLGSLPVVLQHVDWKPDYTGNYCKKEKRDGQWHAEIRLTDLYGNVYDQGFITKKTSRKLSKYYKLSDIMSPNWFQE